MKKTQFPAPGEFTKALHARVDNYFATNKLPKTGTFRMFLKSAIIITLLITFYILLTFYQHSVGVTALLLVLFAQAQVLVGFNIMHDANHGSYSKDNKFNRFMGYSLDLIGAGSVLWRHSHNFLHHTYTNIDGLDDDLETSGLLRLSPRQKWRPLHKFQVFYAIPIYSILTLYWFLFHDFVQFFKRRVGPSELKNVKTKDTVLFLSGKAIYITYMLIVPMFFHSWQWVLLAFVVVNLIASVTISVVFQLAHTLELNKFPTPDAETGKVADEWAIHQLKTTANFAKGNPLATWYLGGLNHQVEHHLFPKMCHIHYPAVGKIVEQCCKEFHIPYSECPSVFSAVKAHFRFLGVMAKG